MDVFVKKHAPKKRNITRFTLKTLICLKIKLKTVLVLMEWKESYHQSDLSLSYGICIFFGRESYQSEIYAQMSHVIWSRKQTDWKPDGRKRYCSASVSTVNVGYSHLRFSQCNNKLKQTQTLPDSLVGFLIHCFLRKGSLNS